MYKDLEEAQNARLDLIARIQNIDTQLAEKKIEAELMNDAQYEAYLAWKPTAIRAKNELIRKLQRTKLWMMKHREEGARKRTVQRGGNGALLAELYALTKSLVAAGADISSDEQRLLDDVAVYLEQH